MDTSPGPKPASVDLHSQQHAAIFERLFLGRGLLRAGAGIRISFTNDAYTIAATGRGGPAQADAWPPVAYAKANSYVPGDWVWVAPDNTAVTAGAIDADTGLTTYATPGLWRCTRAAAPGSVTIGGTPTTAYHLPQLPYPTAGDLTAANVYWAFISGVTAC